jgi:predicted nucleic acid-binding protein
MISGPIVIDASVVVEYLVKARYTEQATRIFRSMLDDPSVDLWAPDLIYPESISALRKLVRIGALSEKAALRAIDNVNRLPIAIATTAPLVHAIWKLKNAVTPYDACYIALARFLKAAFITADHKLARALSRSDDKIYQLDSL